MREKTRLYLRSAHSGNASFKLNVTTETEPRWPFHLQGLRVGHSTVWVSFLTKLYWQNKICLYSSF
jgi:hypothetical protein